MIKRDHQQRSYTIRDFFYDLLTDPYKDVIILSNEQSDLELNMEGRQQLIEEVFEKQNINTFHIKIYIQFSTGKRTYDCKLNCPVFDRNTNFFFYNHEFDNNTQSSNYESRAYIGLDIPSNQYRYNEDLKMKIYKNNYGLIDYLLEQKNNELIHYFAVNVLRIFKSKKPLEPNYDSKNELFFWTSVHVAFLILTSERLRTVKSLIISYIEFYKLKNEKNYSKLNEILLDMFHPVRPTLFFPKKSIKTPAFFEEIKFLDDREFYESPIGGVQYIKTMYDYKFYQAFESMINKSPVYDVLVKLPKYLQKYLRDKFYKGKLYKIEALIKNNENPKVQKLKFKYLVNKFKIFFDFKMKMILKNWILIFERRKEEDARLADEIMETIDQKDAEEGRMLAEEIARLAQKEEEAKLFAIKDAKFAEKRIRLAQKEIFLSNERIRDYENEIKIAEKEIMCIEEELSKSKIKKNKKNKNQFELCSFIK